MKWLEYPMVREFDFNSEHTDSSPGRVISDYLSAKYEHLIKILTQIINYYLLLK